MKLNRAQLRKILIKEACGCMGGMQEYPPGAIESNDMSYQEPEAVDPGSIDKDSVLNSVAILAMAVDCPATRERLLSTVQELMG